MQPDNQQTPISNTDQSTEEWFNSIQPPPQAPPLPELSEPKKTKGKWKIIFVVCVGFLLIVGGAIGYTLLNVKKGSALACLNTKNYKELTGNTTEANLDVTDSFYTDSIYFADNTTSYDSATEATTQELLRKIGAFYKNNSAQTSIIITLTSNYAEGTSPKLAQERQVTLKNDLIKHGIAASHITLQDPLAVSLEPGDTASIIPTNIVISSDKKCVAS